ncbi:hypothetical protein BCR33DRAFT_718929 [Rhizoclosmatium globosum]|uniref:PH domain-containing protein n=1 Tax=Rhizoclosmatium globosum TaxID=329046 RepID=A0A1Y2C2R7_9FUNG|nr:hypothetical protein BCR33DRAFT_718929 [Rhizoclosmatium globosum]|eukprot:ORY41291.1 hypothetical protein BCR33DRAFT_718929 [Rhizoclosmatium globosum]
MSMLSRTRSIASVRSDDSCTSRLSGLMNSITQELASSSSSTPEHIERSYESSGLIPKAKAAESALALSLSECNFGALEWASPAKSGPIQKLSKHTRSLLSLRSPATTPTPPTTTPQPPTYKDKHLVLTKDGKLFLFNPHTRSLDDRSVLKVYGNNIHPQAGTLQKHSWTLRASSEAEAQSWVDAINGVASSAQEALLDRLEKAYSTRSSARGSRLSVERGQIEREKALAAAAANKNGSILTAGTGASVKDVVKVATEELVDSPVVIADSISVVGEDDKSIRGRKSKISRRVSVRGWFNWLVKPAVGSAQPN